MTKLAPRLTIQRSAHRILGTVVGSVTALGIAVVVPTLGVQVLIAVVSLALAMAARSVPGYWVYVMFMTLAVVLLSAPDQVLATGESRLLYNAIGAGVVLLAASSVLLYQRQHSPAAPPPDSA